MGVQNSQLTAYRQYRLYLQKDRQAKKEAKIDLTIQSQNFTRWAISELQGRRVYVQYENQHSADYPSQVYQGRVLNVGPYMPPSLLIKFAITLQPGDEGGEECVHSMEFKCRYEFDQFVQIIE